MKMKYLVPAFLAFSLVSGAVLTSDAFAWSHNDSNGNGGGYHNNEGMGHNKGGGYGKGGGHGGSRCSMGMNGMGMHNGGNLNAADAAKYDDLRQKYQEKVRPLREQLFVKSQELEVLKNATNADVKSVTKAANEYIALEKQIMKEREAFNMAYDKNFQK